MIVCGLDVGENIDKFALVTMRLKGDFKAPSPRSTEMELVNAQIIEPKTLPKDYSEIIGYALNDT